MPSYSILHQTELAFSSALQAIDSGALAGSNVYLNQSADIDSVLEYPALIVAAASGAKHTSLTNSDEITPGSGLFELLLSITIETQIDAEPTTPSHDIHHDRVMATRTFLEDYDTLAPILAAQAAPLQLSALVLEDEVQSAPKARVLTSILNYYVCVS